jgi:hypothetical protein
MSNPKAVKEVQVTALILMVILPGCLAALYTKNNRQKTKLI